VIRRHPQLQQADIHLQLAENGRRTARAALLPTGAVQGGWEFERRDTRRPAIAVIR
jgi:outer membrane protein TolC